MESKAVCELCYHNIHHTRRVVENVTFLAKNEGLEEREITILQTIAWFHDLGYSVSYDEHEDASIAIAISYLRNESIDETFIDMVVNGINATRVPQEPKNDLDRIIADADLFDLGTDEYFSLSEKLFAEWDDCIKPGEAIKMWKISLDFLQGHSYFTQYGEEVLEPKKQANIQELMIKIAVMEKES